MKTKRRPLPKGRPICFLPLLWPKPQEDLSLNTSIIASAVPIFGIRLSTFPKNLAPEEEDPKVSNLPSARNAVQFANNPMCHALRNAYHPIMHGGARSLSVA